MVIFHSYVMLCYYVSLPEGIYLYCSCQDMGSFRCIRMKPFPDFPSRPCHRAEVFQPRKPSEKTEKPEKKLEKKVKAKVDEAEKPKKDTKAGLPTPPHWWDHVCHAMSDFRAGKWVKTEPSLSLLKRNNSNPKSTMMCCHKHILNENMYLLILAYSHEWIQAHNGRIS